MDDILQVDVLTHEWHVQWACTQAASKQQTRWHGRLHVHTLMTTKWAGVFTPHASVDVATKICRAQPSTVTSQLRIELPQSQHRPPYPSVLPCIYVQIMYNFVG